MADPNEPWTIGELMVCELARRLEDGEIAIVGGASVIAMAAALLAQRLHAPNLTLLTGAGAVNPRPAALAPSTADDSYMRSAEGFFTMEEVFDDTERGRWDVGVFGGVEVDRFGNFNLTAVTDSEGRLRLRGPGMVNTGLPNVMSRFMLIVPRQSARSFVSGVSYASGPGTRRPDGAPHRYQRQGRGPDFLVSDLASYRFDEETGQVRVATTHWGIEIEDVRTAVGFPLDVPSDTPVTCAPTDGELATLRQAIDTTGLLRTVGGRRWTSGPGGRP